MQGRLYGVVLVFLLASATASAQDDASTMWRRGTTLNVFGGLAAASNDRGPLAGGAIGWEITPRIAVEGSGAWVEWGHEAQAFSAALRALVPLRTSRPVIPYLAGGFGLVRASFEIADPEVPEFYRRRIANRPEAVRGAATFTDPSVVVGGGVNMFLSRHIAIRPDVNATVVMRDSRARVMTTAAVHLAYHFEDHPITPARVIGGRD